VPELPLSLLLEALVGGVDLAYDRASSTHARGRRRAHRAGGTWRVVPATVDGDVVRSRWADGWRGASDDETASGEVSRAEQPRRLRPPAPPPPTAVGPSFAPAAAFWAFMDRELHAGVGPLEPATGA
jgi:hypothetical protein